jgi:hypothetical protein
MFVYLLPLRCFLPFIEGALPSASLLRVGLAGTGPGSAWCLKPRRPTGWLCFSAHGMLATRGAALSRYPYLYSASLMDMRCVSLLYALTFAFVTMRLTWHYAVVVPVFWFALRAVDHKLGAAATRSGWLVRTVCLDRFIQYIQLATSARVPLACTCFHPRSTRRAACR